MTAASFAQAGQPVSNSTKEMSSDEEDFVSSPSTPTASADALTQARLSTAMDQLQLGNRRPQSPPDNQTAPHKTSSSAEASTAFRTSENAKKKPLALLDLPWDILKEIVKEITHTDDLTSLALTCSALHDLAIPYLYSRFDIVWPEVVEDSSADGSSGVDALSHGLSTLVMGEGIFHQLPQMAYPSTSSSCSLCGCDGRAHASSSGANTRITECASRPRRGNYYAQYTRTFSIANGPISWIREYSVNREVGKMLGTLVALAVARMVNLEAFIWDMPTGVVREIWLALASLANRPGHECRLEQVWVRWHDNKQNLLRANHTSFPRLPRNWRDTRIEYPSLSILPPLKSITVLEIDETAYLDELAVLIERSRTRLIELRIGITSRVRFFNAFLCQKDSDEPNAGWPKPGGVLSVLSCAVENGACRWHEASTQFTHADGSSDHGLDSAATPQQPTEVSSDRHILPGNEKEQSQDLGDEDQSHTHSNVSVPIGEGLASSGPPRHGQLKLRVLELERVHLHAPTLLAAIDWTCLVALTLLGCKDDEQLWKALRRKYSPSVITPPKRTCDQTSSPVESEYPLNLKHLHTDNVSPYLMLFVKESLAPNTLESVYLHEPVHPELSVPIDAIYKYILRRHRLSLRRVLVASPDQSDPDEPRIWMFTREIISFVTSGRMPQLSELGMAIDHSSWHHFLRRIPNMSQLFALYLAKIDHSPQPELRELGLQILDIVSIRPDLKLTYIGVQSKCYQIEEASPGDVEYDAHQHPDSDYETGDPNEESDLGDDSELDSPEQSYISDPLSSGLSDDSDIEIGDDGEPRARLWLHEIPYCDDKISIFKARHAMI